MSSGQIRLINNAVRIVNNPTRVFLSTSSGEAPCKCCASECDEEVSISVNFCEMAVDFNLPIPGFSGFVEDPDPPPDSYLIVNAEIDCTDCGWLLLISICAFCDDTNVFASDGFYAQIPFAGTPESGCCYCPELGSVNLCCFGEQFGIPCVTTTTATVE